MEKENEIINVKSTESEGKTPLENSKESKQEKNELSNHSKLNEDKSISNTDGNLLINNEKEESEKTLKIPIL